MQQHMTDPKEIGLPDIGDFESVDVIEILVAPGDEIKAEDPLITLESDKATMDVPAPFGGIVRQVTVKVGDKVAQGAVIALVDAESGTAAATPEQPISAQTPDPDPIATDSTDSQTTQTVTEQAAHRSPPSLPPPVERSGGALPHASPATRRFARELGADLRTVRGSGPKGRILKQDIQDYVKNTLSDTSAQTVNDASTSGIPPVPQVDYSRWGEIDVQPLSRIQKRSGPHLHRAWLNIPHVTHFDDADITELEAFRQSLNADTQESTASITPLAFTLKALAGAVRRFPKFNSSLADDGEHLVFRKYCNIGIAVDTTDGLIVPVIRDVPVKGLIQLATEMNELSRKARSGALNPEDLQAGCITVSNLGGIGGVAFTPIINSPEVAILGVARARMTPVWDGQDFRPRLMLPLSLSYDHRVIDGAEAARFTVFIRELLEDTRRLLL
ncbi:MAG: dihydrolipoyllysine-residue acetyltransferase [Arenicellales bacterium]|nr:dihydrolipoyllysine-residue acetyltransferase [Arenicellales bacterium]MDP7451822.1 dihydrolipoyllysine-residue acetyltransferase [Arenicellales bacterium]